MRRLSPWDVAPRLHYTIQWTLFPYTLIPIQVQVNYFLIFYASIIATQSNPWSQSPRMASDSHILFPLFFQLFQSPNLHKIVFIACLVVFIQHQRSLKFQFIFHNFLQEKLHIYIYILYLYGKIYEPKNETWNKMINNML